MYSEIIFEINPLIDLDMTMFRLIFNFLVFTLPPTRFFGIKRCLAKLAGIRITHGVSICGHTCVFGRGAVVIGKNSWIGLKNTFYCTQIAEIRIGEYCDIGPEVSFVTGTHKIGTHKRRAGKGTGGNIVIGDGCWIGARVTILGGVTIGDGAIIGAGSLVNKNIPADTIYAGVPAKLIRDLSDE